MVAYPCLEVAGGTCLHSVIVTSVRLLQSVLLRSEPLPDGTPTVRGHDFETGRDLDKIMEAMLCSGFQATNMGAAIGLVNEMVRPRLHVIRSI